ncbi:hypothetical protein [Litchfieldia salsa]|uniref:Histone deacetylase n=1 Tax=Litchfieldia salsa TaxID=930152 RepID=A0A1H0TCT3_9BACI|nr:hypothetical protein [Litchfieldia salsa]SDP51500.1 hypothetical protein SAMN05216565_103405 [Litchfieldia salsa]
MSGSNLVWYASYGSNLDRNRFLCYIEGGTPTGSSKKEVGCRDKTHPLMEKEIIIPHTLYFAKNADRWNNGGVAFIGHGINNEENTLGRMYLITDEQFKDLVCQENNQISIHMDLEEVIKEQSSTFRKSWYGHIVYLGEQDQHPIFTFTSYWDLREVCYQIPSDEYLSTIIRGIKSTYKISDEDLLTYIMSKEGIKGKLSKEHIANLL